MKIAVLIGFIFIVLMLGAVLIDENSPKHYIKENRGNTTEINSNREER